LNAILFQIYVTTKWRDNNARRQVGNTRAIKGGGTLQNFSLKFCRNAIFWSQTIAHRRSNVLCNGQLEGCRR